MRTVHLPRSKTLPRPRAAEHDQVASPRGAGTEDRAEPSGLDRYRAGITGIAPALLLVAIVYHPPLGDLRDNAGVTDALVSDTTRWAVAHAMVGVAAGLVVLAFLAVDGWLRERSETRLSSVGVPFVVVGSVLFAFLPAMEIAMVGVEEAGADVVAVMNEMDTWFLPAVASSALVFGTGVVLFAVAVAKARILSPPLTALVVVGLLVAALSRPIPFGAALYVGTAALLAAMLALALAMLEQPRGTGDAEAGRSGVAGQGRA